VPRAMFDRVKPLLQIERFAFDVELITALWDAKCPMREVPIHWHEIAGGQVRLIRDSWRMMRDVLNIKSRRAGWESRLAQSGPDAYEAPV
jgi:dolichyl-phosphate beta-glucosyltransferase